MRVWLRPAFVRMNDVLKVPFREPTHLVDDGTVREATMQLTDLDLSEVIESVWTSMLGYDLTPCDAVLEPLPDERILVGCVQITGDWELATLVYMPEALAIDVAATMFGMQADELSTEEVRDALGEMANMIGGNIKGILAGGSQLSLPTISEGRDFRIGVPGAEVISSVTYECQQWLTRTDLVGRNSGPSQKDFG